MINELMAANLLFIKETSYWKAFFYYKFFKLSSVLNSKKTSADLAEVFGFIKK